MGRWTEEDLPEHGAALQAVCWGGPEDGVPHRVARGQRQFQVWLDRELQGTYRLESDSAGVRRYRWYEVACARRASP